ncbi:MAG: tryptophan--tRNA ligase [Deltaproteobacteria bacterium]|nr:tryptophan--tRNA ligase [Deltaproteobacteria bacterium]
MTTVRCFSGVRPTGPLHLGNYFGALRNWVAIQATHECLFAVADWHSLTTEYADPSQLHRWSRDVVLDWLGAGIDPERSIIFLQSDVVEHAELHLLLSMITPLGWLERVPTYKELKTQLTTKDLNMYGFLGYPVLQTADIILYKAERVPVGEDQVSHIELCREIVRRFHHLYHCDIFPEPQPLLTTAPRVPGLDRRKMSKSYDNTITLHEGPDAVQKKIMPAVTDPARKRRQDPGNPDVCLIYDYHKLMSNAERQAFVNIECRRAGIGCVDCKKWLLEGMDAVLAPIRERRALWAARPDDVDALLADGARRARAIACETMREVRDAMGLARSVTRGRP